MLESDRPPVALSEYTGFLMNWVASRSRQYFARRLEETVGIHPREFGVLNVLSRNPGITQQAIGESAGVDPSTMVAILDSLEEHGLAERRPHPGDRRKRAVHLTTEGERALQEGRKVAAAVGKEVFGTLTGEERDQLNGILRKLSGLDAQ
jgi:MarR family transcriptional regulator, lower aerobic nicotinate degradation pathway regulator